MLRKRSKVKFFNIDSSTHSGAAILGKRKKIPLIYADIIKITVLMKHHLVKSIPIIVFMLLYNNILAILKRLSEKSPNNIFGFINDGSL